MRALSDGPVPVGGVAGLMQRDESTAQRLVDALVSEGLCEPVGSLLRLPE